MLCLLHVSVFSLFLSYQTRKMHGINIDNSVVILDEAHNIVSELYVSDLFCCWERGRE